MSETCDVDHTYHGCGLCVDRETADLRTQIATVTAERDEAKVECERLRGEASSLRSSLIDVCDSHESMRIFRAGIRKIRHLANDTSKPFDAKEVESIGNEMADAVELSGDQRIERETAEAIAAYIDAEAETRREEGFSYRAVSELAADIRSNAWRPSPATDKEE